MVKHFKLAQIRFRVCIQGFYSTGASRIQSSLNASTYSIISWILYLSHECLNQKSELWTSSMWLLATEAEIRTLEIHLPVLKASY